MKSKDAIAFAFRDLGRRKGRTFLTSLGIVIGVILILLLVSLGIMFNKFLVASINGGSDNTIINVLPVKYDSTNNDPKGSFKIIDDNTLKNIKNIKRVKAISTRNEAYIGDVKFDGKEHYSIYPLEGVNLNYKIYFNNDILKAESKSKEKNFKPIVAGKILNKNNKNEVLVGQYVLPLLGVKNPNDIIGKDITIDISNIDGQPVEPYKKTLKVSGVINKDMPNSRFIVMDNNNATQIMGFLQSTPDFMNRYGYNNVFVNVNDVKNVSKVQNKIEKLGYSATSNQSQAENITNAFNKISMILSILGIIVIIVAAIGIINTMSMTVMERKKSIGIMKALGASSSEIKKLFIIQSASIGFIGGVIGSIVSIGIYEIIVVIISKDYMKNVVGIKLMPSIPLWLILLTIVFAIIISALAGYYPAMKAAKLDPVESLKV